MGGVGSGRNVATSVKGGSLTRRHPRPEGELYPPQPVSASTTAASILNGSDVHAGGWWATPLDER
jgi:hypothetical protein